MIRLPHRAPGFTLVEILVVMAIFGVVIGAVYSLYLTHQKTAYVQDDLVDLQQNLRIAMDSITRDIRMAGMLVPPNDPVTNAKLNPLDKGAFNSYSTSVQINTASSAGQFARIARSKVTAAFSTFSTSVDAPESVDALTGAGAVNVRLIRPNNRSNPVSGMDTYLVLNAANSNGPSVTLKRPGGATFTAGVGIDAGDIIAVAGPPVPSTPPTTDPPAGYDTIVYSLIPCPESPSVKCLARAVNQAATPEVIAGNISSLHFSYLYDDGSEDKNPADPATIRSVRVTIAGETSATSTLSEGPKQRQITSVIKLRNKR